MAQLQSLGYILAALLMLGVLIMLHEAGHFFSARLSGMAVNEFAIGMGPKLWSRRGKSGTLYSVRAFPLGGFCLFYGEDQEVDDPRAYNRQPVWKRILSVICGPLMNFVAAILIATAFFAILGQYVQVPTVGTLLEGAAAQEAGLLEQDEILAINGQAVASPGDVVAIVGQNREQTLHMQIRRGGEDMTLEVTPRYMEAYQSYMIGIVFGWAQRPQPVGTAFVTSLEVCKEASTMLLKALRDMVFRGEGIEGMTGPVGTINLIQEETRTGGLPAFLNLAVVISINLGVINLLPLPGLDGSRLLFLLVEGVRRKPINRNIEGMIHFGGLVLLLGLMAVFTYKDIVALFTGR